MSYVIFTRVPRRASDVRQSLLSFCSAKPVRSCWERTMMTKALREGAWLARLVDPHVRLLDGRVSRSSCARAQPTCSGLAMASRCSSAPTPSSCGARRENCCWLLSDFARTFSSLEVVAPFATVRVHSDSWPIVPLFSLLSRFSSAFRASTLAKASRARLWCPPVLGAGTAAAGCRSCVLE